jgi:predicted metal-dependent peptidase
MRSDRYVALASVLMLGDRVIDNGMTNTAATDGRDEWYNSDFVDTLIDAELRALIIHECKHKMYKHLTTWRHLYKLHPIVANVSCDYVINIQLVDGDNGEGFITMPKVGLFDEQYRVMDTAQVFHLIYDALPEGDDGSGLGGGMDDHDWDGAEELTEIEKGDLEREVDEAIRQGALVAGKLGSGGARTLEDLLRPEIDWREVLREFIQSVCAGNDFSTWSRPNRRFVSAGVYMPSGITERVEDLVITMDTSASIRQRELTAFLSEVVEIARMVRPERVRLLYWDTEVVRDELYTGAEIDSIARSTKPAGGGGTDVLCVTRYMEDNDIKPQAVITFTDGYIYRGWGEWSCPVLWAIYDNNQAKPDCGKVVHIGRNKL